MLSVLIPCYNEDRTIAEIIERVLSVDVDLEIIVVDDGSKDNSRDVLLGYHENPKVKVLFHEVNKGKGAAVKTALQYAKGSIVIVQDADLEYDPNDFVSILRKFNDPIVEIVYGNRWHNQNQRHSYTTFFIGGLIVTLWTNLLFRAGIHDEPTCYKAFRKEIIEKIDIHSKGFEFCPEVTGKLLLLGHKIHEVPIKYFPRNFEEGKKIGWRDGVKALWVLTKIRVTGHM